MVLGVIIGVLLGGAGLSAFASARRRREQLRLPFAMEGLDIGDPGVARRAEQQARRLLEASTTTEDWEMYRELGVLRVWGNAPEGPAQGGTRATRAGAPYAYLIYPFAPVVSYLPQTRDLLGELTDHACGGGRRHRSDAPVSAAEDVLTKWLLLSEEEAASVHASDFQLPGHQHDPEQVRRDLWRLSQWEQARLRRLERERTQPTS